MLLQVLSCFVFAICLSLVWYVPKERWLSFYRDFNFDYVTNDDLEYEARFTDFVGVLLHFAGAITLIRMAVDQLVLFGLWRREYKLLLPALAWNGVSLAFSVLMVFSMIFVNDDSRLSSEAFEDNNFKFLTISSVLILYQIGFEVAVFSKLRRARRNGSQFQEK